MKIKGQFSYQNLEVGAFSLEIVDLLACGVSGCVPTQALLARFHESCPEPVEGSFVHE
jgi:hypothetical protein